MKHAITLSKTPDFSGSQLNKTYIYNKGFHTEM